MVRTPSNYDGTVAYPLLMVYATAGQSRWASERLAGITTAATGAGFIVAYTDHRQLSIETIEQLGTIPDLVSKDWCIDQKRVYVTGHSDGGTVSVGLGCSIRRSRYLQLSRRARQDGPGRISSCFNAEIPSRP